MYGLRRTGKTTLIRQLISEMDATMRSKTVFIQVQDSRTLDDVNQDSFSEMIHKSAGLLLWGDVGTGKTYMAACIANALIEQEYTVKMTNFATIINDLFASEDKNEYTESLMRCSLLIIDDLGAERSTEYAVENVFNVIDRRYRTGKPLIITTNLHTDNMMNETSIDKKRIYDRVFEMCAPVQMKGVSKRKMSADNKIKLLRELNNRED